MNVIRGLLKKARLDMLEEAGRRERDQVAGLENLLKSNLARTEWLRRKGQVDR